MSVNNNNKFIKLSSPWYGQLEKDAAARVLDSQVTCMGIETKLFEEELKSFLGREDTNIICVNSCTAALQLALQGIGIKPGDEIPCCLANTPELIYVMLAASKIGAQLNLFGAN